MTLNECLCHFVESKTYQRSWMMLQQELWSSLTDVAMSWERRRDGMSFRNTRTCTLLRNLVETSQNKDEKINFICLFPSFFIFLRSFLTFYHFFLSFILFSFLLFFLHSLTFLDETSPISSHIKTVFHLCWGPDLNTLTTPNGRRTETGKAGCDTFLWQLPPISHVHARTHTVCSHHSLAQYT